MISVYLMGGLGNQLFQIFSIIAYGMQHGHKFIFPYGNTTLGVTYRTTYWDTLLSELKIFTTFYAFNGTNEIIRGLPVMKHDMHNYNTVPYVNAMDNFRVHGYFQSYKYFSGLEDKIFKLMKLEKKQVDIMLEYPEFYDTTYHIVSMHIRLGDYKQLQESHNVLPMKYYKNALAGLVSELGGEKKIRVLYFCENNEEDNKLTRECYVNPLSQEFPDIEFVKVYDNVPDWKQMLIMSCCDHNIIANSSFSWWGAYFGKKEGRIVSYPSLWFGPKLTCNYTGDMCPPTWRKIEVK
jgi:hypothetical protein